MPPAEDKPPQMPPDWGLTYPFAYLRFPFQIWVRSSYQVWPNGLSYDEQPQDLVEDFEMLLAGLDYEMTYLRDLKNEKR